MASRPSISGGEVAAAAAKLCDRTADTMERPGLPGWRGASCSTAR